MIGQRFGAQYLPIEIDMQEFQHLKSEIDSENAKFEFNNEGYSFKVDDIIERCYKCDLNVTPNVYRLVDMGYIITESTSVCIFIYYFYFD